MNSQSDIKSRRRDPEATVGWVNFPINDPNYRNTGEGGMFVRLVVIDEPGNENYHDKWVPCCGGYQNFVLDETFVGDNRPEDYGESKTNEEDDVILYHFPWCGTGQEDPYNEYCSIDYLAIVTIGATGWSGWNEKTKNLWICTYSDLTAEGKNLVSQFKTLYPGCKVVLQTWLDT